MRCAFLFLLLCISPILLAQVYILSDAKGAADGTFLDDGYADLCIAIENDRRGSEIRIEASEYQADKVKRLAASDFFYVDITMTLIEGFTRDEGIVYTRDVIKKFQEY